jgi:multidrug efflux pump subunit AcrA (membrane-fusion protein)
MRASPGLRREAGAVVRPAAVSLINRWGGFAMPREVEQLPTQPRDPSAMGDLMETLPTYRSRTLIYVLVLLGVVLTVYAALSPVDIIVTAPVALVPVNPVKPIQIDSEGVVVELFVQEGKQVGKGEPLIAVDAKELSTYQFALRAAQIELDDAGKDVNEVLKRREKTMKAQVKAIRERLAALQKGAKLLEGRQTDEVEAVADTRQSWKDELFKHERSTERLEVELKNAQQAAELWRKETDANARLRGKQVVTELQFLNVERSLEEARAAVRKFESMQREVTAEKRLLDTRYKTALAQHDRTMKDLQDQLVLNLSNQSAAEAEIAQREEEYDLAQTDALRKLALAQSRRDQARQQAKLNLRDAYDDAWLDGVARGEKAPSNRLVVKAAEAGIVTKLLVRSPGESVQRGQPLMTIVPDGTRLYAEIRIPNRDIGSIKREQHVRLKLDAYPFADFGTIDGTLGAPLEDPEAPEGKGGESYYRVHATLLDTYGKVGEPQRIRPLNRPDADAKRLLVGMTGVAEVVTDQKTILQLILKPFNELRKSQQGSK